MDRESLKTTQAPLKERYSEEPTLAVDRDAPVGFRTIRLNFDLDTDASEEELATLLKLTERYCVVFQTLSTPPQLIASIATES